MGLPNIPQLPSTVDAKVRQAFQEIRNWFQDVAAQGGLATRSALDNLVLPTVGDQGTVPDPTLPTPGKPRNTTVVGNLETILITWDQPFVNEGLSYYRVHRSETQSVGDAVLVGTTASTMFSDAPPYSENPVVYYYWVRAVNRAEVAGPWDTEDGTPGSLTENPNRVLNLLNQKIGKSQLYGDLLADVNGIPVMRQELTDVANQVLYKVEIISLQGNTVQCTDDSDPTVLTTLIAKVFHGLTDVTDTLPPSCFRWTRTTPAPHNTTDEAWNNGHVAGFKQVDVVSDDIFKKAVFTCTITIPD